MTKIPTAATRVVLTGLAALAPLWGQPDAKEVIRRAVAAEERNWKVARRYEFSERVDERHRNAEGQIKSREVNLYDVMLLEGSPYRWLAAKDDRPLPPKEEAREHEKLRKSVAERKGESAAERHARVTEYERRSEWQREAWRVLPEAYDFRVAGEEIWEGHPAWVIDATPRNSFVPHSRTAEVLAHLQGKLWVAKEDFHLMKGDVRVVETISAGFFLIRVATGSRAEFEQKRVSETWLPGRVRISAAARLGLFKVVRIDQDVVFSKWRSPGGPLE